MTLLTTIGWAVVGAAFGVVACLAGFAVVDETLRNTPLQRYQPCGPAAGIALFWTSPGGCALAWMFFSPIVAAILSLVIVALSVAFASLNASD